MRIRKFAAALAASAACFSMLALASPAGAASLDIYDSGGNGDGLVTTFAMKPSIFDPLLQGGLLHTESEFSSQGGGIANSLSAPIFPGTFAIGAIKGAVGCAGLPAGWLFGTYPPVPTCPRYQEFTAFDSSKALNVTAGPAQTQAALKEIRDRANLTAIHARAMADFGIVESYVKTSDFTIRQDTKTPPIVSIRDVHVTNNGARTASSVAQTIQVETTGIELLGGLVKIGSIISTATTASDGFDGTARATLRIADVTVTVNGATYAARIDQHGIKINDLDNPQAIGVNEALTEALLRAEISIRASSPVQTIDGSSAQASVGGLQITFGGSAPPVVFPEQVAPAYAQIINAIPTKCVYEFVQAVDEQTQKGSKQLPQGDQIAHVPLCFGAGILPGSRTAPTLSISIASVDAFSVASSTTPFQSGGGDTGSIGGGFSGGTNVLGAQFGNPGYNPGGGSFVDPNGGADSHGNPTSLGSDQRVVAFGIVARMPSWVPLLGGILFLVLAVGVALGPSLRHARAS